MVSPVPSKPVTTYTVAAGDNMWKIAHKTLGNGRRWSEIYQVNKDIIKNANLIYVGQVLDIPAA